MDIAHGPMLPRGSRGRAGKGVAGWGAWAPVARRGTRTNQDQPGPTRGLPFTAAGTGICEGMIMTRLQPVHPGEVLKHDFMDPFGLSATALAKAIGVTPARINEIVRGRRGITATTALRLAKYYGTDAQSWMNLQARYELALAESAAAQSLQDIRPLAATVP